jgi:ubiquinone/menaquinone biosynthesis C-methylase UbiE
MSRRWDGEQVLTTARGFQAACVLGAAAELDVFRCLAERPGTARDVAGKLRCDARAMAVLLDALAALELLEKSGGRYSAPPSVASLLAGGGEGSVLSAVLHLTNCLRRWSQLARVVQAGAPLARIPSIRGEDGDLASFIGAMHDMNASIAAEVIGSMKPLRFRRLLDIGGASGTWTIEFLKATPGSTAILFDLPEVMPLARKRLAEAGMAGRVELAAGDFMSDPLPAGADLAWLSAIAHQNSREENRALFASIFRSLAPGGRIAVRDMVMDQDRTSPPAGALFAVNMLVGTEGGGTFTLDEYREDLESAGFAEVSLARRDEGMSSIVLAVKREGKGGSR